MVVSLYTYVLQSVEIKDSPALKVTKLLESLWEEGPIYKKSGGCPHEIHTGSSLVRIASERLTGIFLHPFARRKRISDLIDRISMRRILVQVYLPFTISLPVFIWKRRLTQWMVQFWCASKIHFTLLVCVPSSCLRRTFHLSSPQGLVFVRNDQPHPSCPTLELR